MVYFSIPAIREAENAGEIAARLQCLKKLDDGLFRLAPDDVICILSGLRLRSR
jgi:hypothetical protein